MTIGGRVKEARQKLKLGQRGLAKAAGISLAYVSFIENDKKHPTIKTIASLAKALGVTPEHLAYGK